MCLNADSAPFFEHFLLIFLHLLQSGLLRATLLGFEQIGGHPLLHVLQPPPELLEATLKPKEGGIHNLFACVFQSASSRTDVCESFICTPS